MRRYACTAALPPVRGAIMMDAARSALRRARAEPPLRPQDRAGDGCRRAIHRLRPLQGPLLLRPSGMMGLRLWEEESYTRTSTCTHAGDSEGTPHCAGHDCSTSVMPFSCRTKFCSASRLVAGPEAQTSADALPFKGPRRGRWDVPPNPQDESFASGGSPLSQNRGPRTATKSGHRPSSKAVGYTSDTYSVRRTTGICSWQPRLG